MLFYLIHLQRRKEPAHTADLFTSNASLLLYVMSCMLKLLCQQLLIQGCSAPLLYSHFVLYQTRFQSLSSCPEVLWVQPLSLSLRSRCDPSWMWPFTSLYCLAATHTALTCQDPGLSQDTYTQTVVQGSPASYSGQIPDGLCFIQTCLSPCEASCIL